MIRRIADEIAFKLTQDLSWCDFGVGIVKPITYQSKTGTEITEPVYYNGKRDFCNGSDYITLVPNSKRNSMFYFELNNNSVEAQLTHGVAFNAELNLVFWVNLQKINLGMVDTDMLVADVISKMPEKLPSDVSYNRVFIEVTGTDIEDGSVFNKYTYNEQQQYLTYPYSYFNITVSVDYAIPKDCMTVFENTEECNLKPNLLTTDKDEVEEVGGVIKY
jgi:hypothetical protein